MNNSTSIGNAPVQLLARGNCKNKLYVHVWMLIHVNIVFIFSIQEPVLLLIAISTFKNYFVRKFQACTCSLYKLFMNCVHTNT